MRPFSTQVGGTHQPAPQLDSEAADGPLPAPPRHMVASLLLAGGTTGAALHSSSPTSLLEASSSLTPPSADAALNVSSLSIDGGAGSESLLSLGNFVLSSTPAGDFEVRAPDGRTALSVDAAGAVSVHGQLHARGSLRVDGKLNYLGLSQWFLARAESFEASCSAWSNCTRTSCGAIRMLGGYGAFAGGEVPPSPANSGAIRRNSLTPRATTAPRCRSSSCASTRRTPNCG